jgi:hypothetical protein
MVGILLIVGVALAIGSAAWCESCQKSARERRAADRMPRMAVESAADSEAVEGVELDEETGARYGGPSAGRHQRAGATEARGKRGKTRASRPAVWAAGDARSSVSSAVGNIAPDHALPDVDDYDNDSRVMYGEGGLQSYAGGVYGARSHDFD